MRQLSSTVRHFLFVRGRTEMAEFRGWYRQVQWADHLAHGGLPLAVRFVLKTPARSAREAVRAVRRYGHTGVELGASRPRQLALLWWLNVRHSVVTDTFYRYQLYANGRRQHADRIVQGWEAARAYRLLAADCYRPVAEMLADKRLFTDWCEERRLECIPILRTFADGRPAGEPCGVTKLPPCDLFSKTAYGYGGKAAARWRWDGAGGWTREGRTFSERELLAELAARSGDGPVVLQRGVNNHRALAGIGGRALATVRVMTTQAPDEVPRLLLAVFRMGAADAEMDNFSRGGMVCGVDLATGRLGRAIGMDDDLRTHDHDTHPDTGAPITGTQLPYWPAVIDLALRAHTALGEYPCVGWDVAILDDGPVLLEGNWNPGVRIAQLPLPVPLGDTEFVRCLNAHLRRHFPRPDWELLRRHSVWEPHGGTNLWMAE